MKKYTRSALLGFLVLSAAYGLTHLPFLSALPVFADEAIYIRWAQLILDDWRQYFFFALNDGKTPLFIWLVSAALRVFQDPLIAGRFISVCAGLGQVWANVWLVKKLGGQKLARFTAAALTAFLPFWYFHHRIALMDSLMVLWLSLSWGWLITSLTQKRLRLSALVASGLSFGLALLTKIPAILFAPAFILTPWFLKSKKITTRMTMGAIGCVLLVGLGVFFSLKLHPAFSQLFSRGSDFLYPFEELKNQGLWHVFSTNWRTLWTTLSGYLTLPVLLLPFAGLFQNTWRRKHALLLLCAASFALPILLVGKTVYPRYFLPLALPLTLSAALAFEQFFLHTQRQLKRPFSLLWRLVALVLGLTFVLSVALEYILVSWRNTDRLAFVPADRTQYVTEWSSGHGIRQTAALILQESQTHSVAVATEGYFGTLPDGILMYLHNKDVSHLLVEGIGQPVQNIPEDFRQKAQNYDKVWLVVNAHREKMNLKTEHLDWLFQKYCRPTGNPCLELWDITPLIHPPDLSTP